MTCLVGLEALDTGAKVIYELLTAFALLADCFRLGKVHHAFAGGQIALLHFRG